MKKIQIFIILLINVGTLFSQNPTEKAQPIAEEGKLLYQSEMASWHGTDLFLERYDKRENIGGYFSYSENDAVKCVFFSRDSLPIVIGTITFDTTFRINTALVDLNERNLSKKETDLFVIRRAALIEIQTDTLFKTYENTNLNLIPLVKGNEKKVYVLTGPKVSGVVIFGNDYLISFDENNNVISKRALHKNIIPIYYGAEQNEGEDVFGAMHSHLPETGEFITPTDICTLMMYSKYANWKTHHVVSKEYLNVWNCETNSLTVVPMGTIDKISKDQDKRQKKKNKKGSH